MTAISRFPTCGLRGDTRASVSRLRRETEGAAGRMGIKQTQKWATTGSAGGSPGVPGIPGRQVVKWREGGPGGQGSGWLLPLAGRVRLRERLLCRCSRGRRSSR